MLEHRKPALGLGFTSAPSVPTKNPPLWIRVAPLYYGWGYGSLYTSLQGIQLEQLEQKEETRARTKFQGVPPPLLGSWNQLEHGWSKHERKSPLLRACRYFLT